MNILVICHYGMYQDLSASFVHAQAKAYAELGHNVHALIPIAFGKTREDHWVFPLHQQQLVDGVHLHYIRFLSLSNYGKKHFNLASVQHAIQTYGKALFKQFSPDVIHAHTVGFDSAIGIWLKKKIGCPLVVTTHGSDVSIPYEQGRRDYLKKRCENVDTVVAVSSALAKKLKSCGTGVPVLSVLNGFNLQHLPENLAKEPLTLLQVSNLNAQKRVDVTIRAFAEIEKKYPGAKLVIVGDGPERENLEILCCELGVSAAVRFTGRIDNARVLEEMAKAQFFSMPSVREGFGIVYIEAMACGCVTIGTQGEGVADLIVNGENGFLVPPDDSHSIVSVVMQCLENPELAKKIAEEGKKTAVGLTWGVNVQKYINVFKELGSNANIAD